VKQLADEEVSKLPQSTDYTQAQNMFIETSVNDDYLEFLTLPAYEAMA
jgi:malate synthase